MADNDYEVGRGRPPKHAQFKKGQSGNPTGRRKKCINVHEAIERELAREILITDRGRRKRITTAEALAKSLVSKAAQGDTRALRMLLEPRRQSKSKFPHSEDGGPVVIALDMGPSLEERKASFKQALE